jgi:hypothetical protein
MVTQYPHSFTYQLPGTSTLNEATGNWSSTNGAEKTITCRAEPNKGDSFINGADGNRILYDYVLYMPLPVDEIVPGTNVSLTVGLLNVKNTVKRFSKGQLNARLWL